ncbi:MAG: YgjV family protein [Ruminococcaceae bacterium]|nr:YgjV family protein [Oscillospiraceae bacterium]
MVDFFTNDIVIQIIGFIGMFLSIISFQSKSYQKIIWIRVASEFVFAVQYFLLGAYTGMATNLTSCVTNSIYRERIKRGKKTLGFQIAFGILFAVIGILSWHGPVSLLVIAAKILSTVANGNSNPKTLRIFNLIINPLWLIYDIIVFSLAGIFSDAFTIISIIIAMVRLDKKRKDEIELQ